MRNGPGALAGSEEAGAGIQVPGGGGWSGVSEERPDPRGSQMRSPVFPAPQPLQAHQSHGHRGERQALPGPGRPALPPPAALAPSPGTCAHVSSRPAAPHTCLRSGHRAPQPTGRAHVRAQSHAPPHRAPWRAAAGTRRRRRARWTREVAAALVGSGRPPRRSLRPVRGGAAQVSGRAGPRDPAAPALRSPPPRAPTLARGPLSLSAPPGLIAPRQAPSAPPGNFEGPLPVLGSPCSSAGAPRIREADGLLSGAVGTPGGMRPLP